MPFDDPLSILADASRGFDTAMRGYDRRQVDEFIADMDEDLRQALVERDSAAARSADLAAQLASTQAQIESLKRQVRSAAEAVTIENVDAHVQQLVDSARKAAAQLRLEADQYASATRAAADSEAERIRAAAEADSAKSKADSAARLTAANEAFTSRITEADRYRTEVHAQIAADIADAARKQTDLDAAAQATRQGLDADAQALRDQRMAELHQREADSAEQLRLAEEDFEIVLRERRSAETKQSEDLIASSQAMATRTIAIANAQAAKTVADTEAETTRMVSEAIDEVRRLHQQRDELHAGLQELHRRLGAVVDTVRSPTP